MNDKFSPQHPILQAKNLSKIFISPSSVEILKDVSLELYTGKTLAIMGASGEGKSTLLHILGTLEKPTTGTLKIAGKSITSRCPSQLRCQHIGFIFQSYNLLEDYTTLQNVLMPALIAKKDITRGAEAYQRACELLEKVGLGHRMHFNTRLLSGGEKQRAAIARALCNDPEIILADEPSGNLDHHTSQIIHELLLHCAKDLNKALVIVTHDRELAKHCDQIFFLKNGMLEYSNPLF